MAIQIGNNNLFNGGYANVQYGSWLHTVAPGSNLLLVGVGGERAYSAASTVDTLTYNGVSLTKLWGARASYDGNYETDCEVWYMVNPPQGVEYSLEFAMTALNTKVIMGSVDFSGVKASDPFGERSSQVTTRNVYHRFGRCSQRAWRPRHRRDWKKKYQPRCRCWGWSNGHLARSYHEWHSNSKHYIRLFLQTRRSVRRHVAFMDQYRHVGLVCRLLYPCATRSEAVSGNLFIGGSHA